MSALAARWKIVRYRRAMRRLAGPKLLRAFAEQYPRASFVEIGANDGARHDHLHALVLGSDWTGILVEPVPYLFERLRRNYQGIARVKLENAAVADRDGVLPFHHLPDVPSDERAGLPEWYDAIGSFSRETVLAHAASIPGLAERIVQTQVRSLTFASLCERHGFDHVDLVAIDTEGYDGQIVRIFPFERFAPRLFLYEHFHLAPGERRETREHLHRHGYETMEEGLDTFALRTGADDALTRRWYRLQPAVAGVSKADEVHA